MRVIVVLLFMALLPLSVYAQTDTPTPTPTTTPTITPSPTMEPAIYMTLPPLEGTPDGQLTRFDYTLSAGERHIADMLTWLLYSVWGMFLFAVLVLFVKERRK
jgi:hypothetical protein